jgi:hypothetical protein
MSPLLMLKLGRASNLPTLWTNTLVAGLLCGAGLQPLLPLMLAGSLLYLAGCSWNDAKDAAWDAQHKPDRPIPSGIVSAKAVWTLGGLEAAIGLGILAFFGLPALLGGLLTLAAIAVYTWLHKRTPWAVLAMAWCRVQWALTVVFALGSAVSAIQWYLASLAACILFISLCARHEALKPADGNPYPFQIKFLLAAVILPYWMATKETPVMGAAVALWIGFMVYSHLKMQRAVKAGNRQGIGDFVANALAAICLLDAAYLAPVSPAAAAAALAAFGLAKASQRFVPAT